MKIRNAARTVIIDKTNDKIALINVRNGEYYKIPGGGIDEGESEKEAAKREAMEESGCDINIISKIGESHFIENSPEYGEITHRSVCFLANKIGNQSDTSFDAWEKSNDMKLIWVSVAEAIDLFLSVKTNDEFAARINQRDYEFVLNAKSMLGKL